MTPPNISFLTFIATQAALKAGDRLRRGFGTMFEVSAKSGKHNPVTEFDKSAEKIIIDTIREYFPDHGFLAEESGASHETPPPVLWIIDPLDGTLNFSHHVPIFTVSIAAYYQNEVVCGVIYQPMTDELFVSEKGKGAYLNGFRLKVSKTAELDQAMMVSGLAFEKQETAAYVLDHLIGVLKRSNPIRDIGSAALSLAYVAAGRFDIYWAAMLYPWDVAAGKLLIEEAGGKVTHFNGASFDLFSQETVLATNALLHHDALQLFKS